MEPIKGRSFVLKFKKYKSKVKKDSMYLCKTNYVPKQHFFNLIGINTFLLLKATQALAESSIYSYVFLGGDVVK